MKNSRYMKRNDFIECVRCTYKDDNMDYLLALRDALNIIIQERFHPEYVDRKYEGYIKYQ